MIKHQKTYLFKILVILILVLIPHSNNTKKLIYWPSWFDFKRLYISPEGRVIDTSSPNKITTSEGQSYGLFFALIANDRFMFDRLLRWTENNLAKGDLSAQLPAWLWGKNTQNQWTVLDQNSASDSDLWIAYDLIEAGRLWKNTRYKNLGMQLLNRIFKEEVADIPGLGKTLLPGKIGFVLQNNNWRLNPSYLPPQILAKFKTLDTKWHDVEQSSLRIVVESSPKGLAPDWIIWNANTHWSPDTKDPNIGSYNAIRVYLWVGTLADSLGYKKELVEHFSPMVTLTQQQGTPPEKVNTATGEHSGTGPIGFSAALLPLMADSKSLKAQRIRVERSPFMSRDYYNSVLKLFGQGFNEGHYRFSSDGTLILEWGS